MTAVHLLAPGEIVAFVAAYLLVAVVPGYALAALLYPRGTRLERAALGLPCAYSLVTLTGLLAAALHIPFDLRVYGLLALSIVAAAAYAGWPRDRRRATHDTGEGARPDPMGAGAGRWWRLVPVGVGIVQPGILAAVFRRYVVPPDVDVVSHVQWTGAIARLHVFPLTLLGAQTGSGGFYPPAFHALTGLVLALAPMPVAHAVFYTALAVVPLLPVALFCYTRRVTTRQIGTGSERVAGLAALLSLAFVPLPFMALTQGIYPFTVSLLIVPALAAALADALSGSRRAIVLCALLGSGLFYTHPTEFLTVGLLLLALLPDVWRSLRGRRAWAQAALSGAAVLAAWVSVAAPALSAARRTMTTGAQPEMRQMGDFARAAHVAPGRVAGDYLHQVFGFDLGYGLLLAAVAGLVWCLARRRLYGLAVVQAILTLLYLDAQSYTVLQRLYMLSFPWALPQRLGPTHYWVSLPLAAIGVEALAGGLRRLPRPRGVSFAAIAAVPAAVFGLLLPLSVIPPQTDANARAQTVVAPADVAALTWLARYGRPGTTVVNDMQLLPRVHLYLPLDAGLWMPVAGAPRPLFWRFNAGPGAPEDRLSVLDHIADPHLPERARRFIALYHVAYVFYAATPRPGSPRHLNVRRLLADPALRLVYSSVPSCAPGAPLSRRCPATGAYVFALRGMGR